MHNRILGLMLAIQTVGLSQYQSWIGADFTFKPLKKTKVELGIENRNIGITQWNRTFVKAKVSYKILQGVTLFSGYRIGLAPNNQSALDLKEKTFLHRPALGIELNPMDWVNDQSRFSLGITNQLQWNRGKFLRPNTVFRSKLSAMYDIKNFPISPFVSWEYFYNFHRDITYTANEIIISGGTNAFRSFVGMEIELPKKQAIKLAAGRRTNYLSGQVRWIYSLNYSLSIK